MIAFVFKCPNTGLQVQSWRSGTAMAGDYFEAVECTACKRVHFVDPRNGKVPGRPDRDAGERTVSHK